MLSDSFAALMGTLPPSSITKRFPSIRETCAKFRRKLLWQRKNESLRGCQLVDAPANAHDAPVHMDVAGVPAALDEADLMQRKILIPVRRADRQLAPLFGLLAEIPVHRAVHVLLGIRLGQIVHGFQRIPLHAVLAARRDEHDLAAGIDLSELPRRVDAVEMRHVNIQKYDLPAIGLPLGDQLRSVGSGFQLELHVMRLFVSAQLPNQVRAFLGQIVTDQYGYRHLGNLLFAKPV